MRKLRELVLFPALVVVLFLGEADWAMAQKLVPVDAREFRRVFSAGAKVELVAANLGFTEGPVWIGERGGHLVFSDIPANRLMRWSRGEGLSVYRDPSYKANGNTLDLQGRLVTAEHGARRVSITKWDGDVETIVATYDGGQLNSPNDVVFKSDGTMWFTDPDYGLGDRAKEQPGNFVYRYDPLTEGLEAVVKDFDKPNGLAFSPDEDRLYVADSGRPRHIRVFRVRDRNHLDEGKVFARIDKGGPDGIRCDSAGRVWSSSGDGVQVFMPDGTLIARIELPQGGANLCFGGEGMRTLFITARTSVWRVETRVVGRR